MTSIQPILVFLLLATLLGGLIGWLARKLKDGRHLYERGQQLVAMKETIGLQRAELASNQNKNDYINSLVTSQAAPMADANFNSEYDRLKDSEKDLRLKLSQLYAKKQNEIEKVSARLKDLEARLYLINSESTIEVYPDELANELNKRLEESEAEKHVYKNRVDQLENDMLTASIKEPKTELIIEKSFQKPAPTKKVKRKTNAKVKKAEDDLTLIKGIGPKIRNLLHAKGIVSFKQVSEFTDKDINSLSNDLGKFGDRIERDEWVRQAQELLQKDGKTTNIKKKRSAKKQTKPLSVDDLTVISGVGKKLAGILNESGIFSYEQIANLKSNEIDELSKKLGSFSDRIKRDDWVGQAKQLKG